MDAFRSFAIVPAAGRSRRMGRPKLLLNINGRPLIDIVLSAWTRSEVQRVVVVLRAADAKLRRRCERFPVTIVVSDQDTPDMRASVELGLRHLETHAAPAPPDAWLTAPADLPALSAELINLLLSAHDPRAPSLIAPDIHGQRGHPLLLPWEEAASVRSLPAGAGLNALVAGCAVRRVAWRCESILRDIDTPADYCRFGG